jgi:hypothetical protein
MFSLIEDLEKYGSIGLDFVGANLPSVSYFKESWGARLVPYFFLEDFSFRQLGKWVRDWYRYWRKGRKLS